MNVIKGHGTNEIQSKFLIIANPISSTSLFRVGGNFHPLQRSKNIWMQIKALFSRNKTARFMINCVTPIDPWLKEWNNERRNRWANSSEVARSRQLAMFKEKERERERNVSGVTSLHGVSNKSSFGWKLVGLVAFMIIKWHAITHKSVAATIRGRW